MLTPRLRDTRPALLILTLLALCACAHSPSRGDATKAAIVPPQAAAPLTPPPSEPSEAAPVVADTAAPGPPGPTQVAGLTPAQYADLFDRMRAGFKLDDGADRRAVDDQLRWYASNPDYLQRAFGRADLYLYRSEERR